MVNKRERYLRKELIKLNKEILRNQKKLRRLNKKSKDIISHDEVQHLMRLIELDEMEREKIKRELEKVKNE